MNLSIILIVGWDSLVSIVTPCGLEIEFRWGGGGGGEIFHTCPDQPWGPPSLLYIGYRVFPGFEAAGGVALTTHPLWAFVVSSRVNF